MSTLTGGETTRAASEPSATRPIPRSRTGPRVRMPIGFRRVVLVFHLLSAGAWIGIDVIVAVLVLIGWFGGDAAVRGLAYQALATFVVVPMLVAGLCCLLSGLALGLATKWGLARYWWVLIKLALNLILCTLIVVALNPGMDQVAAAGSRLSSGSAPGAELSTLFFPPAVSLTALSVAVVLSVFKPRARVGRSSRRG